MVFFLFLFFAFFFFFFSSSSSSSYSCLSVFYLILIILLHLLVFILLHSSSCSSSSSFFFFFFFFFFFLLLILLLLLLLSSHSLYCAHCHAHTAQAPWEHPARARSLRAAYVRTKCALKRSNLHVRAALRAACAQLHSKCFFFKRSLTSSSCTRTIRASKCASSKYEEMASSLLLLLLSPSSRFRAGACLALWNFFKRYPQAS